VSNERERGGERERERKKGEKRREKKREGRNNIDPEYGGFEVHIRFLKVADAVVHW
jgi:hypothetical protein